MSGRVMLCLGATGLLLAGSRASFPDHPPVGHTGGFGEPTCHSCHFDLPFNEGGALSLHGVPDTYTPGASYRLTIELVKADMGRGGFQLATRFATGAHEGQQAGVLKSVGESVAIEVETPSTVQYAHQTLIGTEPAAVDTARWVLDWVAPLAAHQAVVFHLAANAANDDASAFGDAIFATERQSEGREGAK